MKHRESELHLLFGTDWQPGGDKNMEDGGACGKLDDISLNDSSWIDIDSHGEINVFFD